MIPKPNLRFLNQLIDAMYIATEKLEEAIRQKNNAEIEQAKGLILALQKQTKEIITTLAKPKKNKKR